jgi:aminoglycoside phosphotransferase family enzyme/predicted kinase
MNTTAKPSELVEALLNPGIYPHHPQEVELTQTQMSFVFLTGDYVYKIKKPVNLGYLDYTTLEKRLFFCRQEIELNKRLSPEIYLDVVPIKMHQGQYHLGGTGDTIEYAVKMKQLPRDRTMDVLLNHGQVTTEMVQQVAARLAPFHDMAATNTQISGFGRLDAIMININENYLQTAKYQDISISPAFYKHIQEYNNKFTDSHRQLFQERIEGGRIRDCHGDLHCAHICFNNGIYIFDCIEFNDRFRYCDVASEVAFLAMDLDRYQRTDLSRAFIDAYISNSKDDTLYALLKFYKCYRAYVRGKVESFKLDDPYIKEKETALASARSYFTLAYRYAREKPNLILISGMVGTGKSTVAEALGREMGFSVLSSDLIRKGLAGIYPTEHHPDPLNSGLYSPELSYNTYAEMFTRARKLLAEDETVILDASFKNRQDRAQAANLAKEAGSDFLIIECVLDEASVKKRLEQRLNEDSISDGRWEIFEAQKQDFDKIIEFPQQSHIILNTAQPVSNLVKTIVERI